MVGTSCLRAGRYLSLVVGEVAAGAGSVAAGAGIRTLLEGEAAA